MQATTDDIKELNAFAQCNDQDTRDAYADCDEHYVEYFSANIDDWCNASRLQAEYDDMDTQKMLADIGAMLEEPMSGGRIAQEIAVAEASICTLDDDRSSHDAQSGTNAWEAAVEHDLEPFRYVIVFTCLGLLFGALPHENYNIQRIMPIRSTGGACVRG